MGALLPTFLYITAGTQRFSMNISLRIPKRSGLQYQWQAAAASSKGAAYCTDMQQFSALSQDAQVLPFDISREAALSDTHLLEVFEAKAKDHLVGTDVANEVQLTLFRNNVIRKNCIFLITLANSSMETKPILSWLMAPMLNAFFQPSSLNVNSWCK